MGDKDIEIYSSEAKVTIISVVDQEIIITVTNKYGIEKDQHMEAENSSLSKIFECIMDMKHLEVLAINLSGYAQSYCQFEVLISNSLTNLIDLKGLSIIGCHIRNVPKTIKNLKNLKELIIEDCMIESIYESFENLENLLKISFCNNELTKFPDVLKCTSLEKLNLKGNKL